MHFFRCTIIFSCISLADKEASIVTNFRFPIFIFDNKIAYNLDIKFFYDDNYLDKIKGIKCWFVGCLRYDDHPSHASYKEVIDWTKKVNANQTFLSHMTAHIDYETEFEKLSKSRVYPAYDGLKLTI
ncbi:hypothetical protein OA966_02300 [Alphaproteobacteria bacterium]|nr:hypothetical protein [Alphaproteobacteria bacterium]